MSYYDITAITQRWNLMLIYPKIENLSISSCNTTLFCVWWRGFVRKSGLSRLDL